MTSKTETAPPLTFERFGRWLLDHPTCVVRAGSEQCLLLDHDDFHWDFLEEEDGHVIVQLVKGKALVAELIISRRDVQFVQASIDPENATAGYWLFELIGGPKEDAFTVAHVLMSHGMEQQQGHQLLKH